MTSVRSCQNEGAAVQEPGEARQGVCGRAPRDRGPPDVRVRVRGPERAQPQGERGHALHQPRLGARGAPRHHARRPRLRYQEVVPDQTI